MDAVGSPEDDESPHALPSGRLGATAAALFGLAAAAPVVTLVTLVPSALAGGAGPLVPIAFAVLAGVLLLFCSGYAAMARRAPSAGAAYAYVARGLGRPAGLTTAWLMIAGYQAIQFGLYALAGAAAAPLLSSWFSVTAPWWAVAAAGWLLVALLGTMRVEVAAGLVALPAVAQVAVLTGLGATNLLQPFGGRITASSIEVADWGGLDRPALGLLLAAGVLAFAGFETAGNYTEETVDPRRSSGRGGYGAVALIAVLLAGVSWTVVVAAGPERVATVAGARGPELLFDLAEERLLPWAVTTGRAALVLGILGAVLALHHALARYLHALGRERVLPGVLGRTARRTGAPRAASVTQSLIAGAALAGALAAGADPGPATARRLIVAGALSVLVVLLLMAVAALLHLNRAPGSEGGWTRFAPVLSTVLLGVLAYLAFRDLPALLDLPAGHQLVRAVVAGLAGCVLAGTGHALVLRAARPALYAGIGLGSAVVVLPPLPPGPAFPELTSAPPASRPASAPPPAPVPAPEPTPAPTSGPGSQPEGGPASPPEVPQQRDPGAHRPERIHREVG